jgi:hypothetical protein
MKRLLSSSVASITCSIGALRPPSRPDMVVGNSSARVSLIQAYVSKVQRLL